jgi:cysteinyl-tRNA synthetase
MSTKHLGDTIDLHTGGVDLLFPHHENEIAQSECCNGVPFARHWYHSEHLLVDGKKMSKSLGNLYTLDELIAKGFTAAGLRYALLAGHPRKQLNFTLESLATKAPAGGRWQDSTAFAPVIEALEDDLNTPGALGRLFGALKPTMESPTAADRAGFEAVVFSLGLDLREPKKADIPAEIQTLAEKRWAAKQARDFAAADALRKELTAAGWTMLDRKDGFSLEPAKK